MVYAKVPTASLSVVQSVHKQSKRDQFLMKLCPKFEVTRSNLMNRDPSPSLDVYFWRITSRGAASSHTGYVPERFQPESSSLCSLREREG
jgi:hypothetical protein